MDDLSLLDQHGPAATSLTDDTLAAARARLGSALAAPAPRRRRLPLLAAAAATAAGLALAPAVLKSDHSLALAAADPLTFPVTATWLPPGLPLTRFTYSPQEAMYGADPSCASGTPCVGQRVSVSVRDDWQGWEVPDDARRVDVNGASGRLFEAPWAQDQPELHLVWEQPDGDVIGVTGEGRYADPATLERIAESVVDRSQPVALFLTVAPAGWHVYGYVSDHHVSYGDEGQLAITLINAEQVDLEGYGARDAHTVSVAGRHGVLGRQVDEDGDTVAWILTSTAPDGQAFSLQAPGELTGAQVVEIAAGVRHR